MKSTSSLSGPFGQNPSSFNLLRGLRSPFLSMLSLGIVALLFASAPVFASPGSAEDAATIKASSDPIYQVRIIKLYGADGQSGTVKANIENVLRGDDSKTGGYLELFWDTDYPQKNQNWVVMVTTNDDGTLHVHPSIRYDVSEESIGEQGKASWIQMEVLAEPSEERSQEDPPADASPDDISPDLG